MLAGEDPSGCGLTAAERESVSEIWLARAHGELCTAAVAEQVEQVAHEIGASSEVLQLSARATEDELRHARLCRDLAESYAGRALLLAGAPAFAAPSFGDAPRELSCHLFLIYQSCLNEGIASAYLQENLRLARAPAARELIHTLLCDDVVHARIGWAHLASVRRSTELRRHVTAALPTLLRLARAAWLGPATERDFDCPEHGCLGRHRHPAIVEAAIQELILPGFAHLGVSLPAPP
jgi:hypothetical protein